MTLTPSTPPGSPALQAATPVSVLPSGRFRDLWQHVRQAYLEPQDRLGNLTLVSSVACAISTSLALAVSINAKPFLLALRHGLAWYFIHFSSWVWALPIILGLSSERRMPRLLAWFNIGIAMIYYGWDWLPIPSDLPPIFHSASTIVKAALIVTVGLTAVPMLLRRLFRRGNAA